MGDIVSNLTAWWKCDETSGTTLADSSGNAYPLTTVNSPTLGGASIGGSLGTNIAFNGTTQYASLASSLGGLPYYPLTVVGWVKKDTLATQTDYFELSGASGKYIRLQCRTDGSFRVLRYDTTASEFGAVSPLSLIQAGVWSHLGVVIKSPTSIDLYHDGVLVRASVGLTANSFSPFTAVYLGKSLASSLAGGMSDIRLYARDLVAGDIADIYALAAPVNEVAPVASGTPTVGQTLSCTTGTWSDGTIVGYQWQRDGGDISGATSNTYELVADDANTDVTCDVTYGNTRSQTTTASSNALAVSAPAGGHPSYLPWRPTWRRPAISRTI